MVTANNQRSRFVIFITALSPLPSWF
jgi:hypothetical protein